MNKPITIISLGGSLLVTKSGIATSYITAFVRWAKTLARTRRLVIFVGGGATARLYIQAARTIHHQLSVANQDWIGISASRLNAELLLRSFGGKAYPNIITDPRWQVTGAQSLYIGAGWKPGRSTDYDAVMLASYNAVPQVINLSNIDYVYDRDPQRYRQAQPLQRVSWVQFQTIVGKTWLPGLNMPFDPIAAKLAKQKNISVAIAHGKNLGNVSRLLAGQSFRGTLIHNSSS
ncbi:MAG: UMP kinase [Candidatus Kerfeldbacteria bacterium]|nr:UMP kinase [Candidatus Kerfeldbacteria bacterium]